jgi:hypothetical protein
MSEATDCEAYSENYFATRQIQAEGQFERIEVNTVPMCYYVIVGADFYQVEFAFWHPIAGRPFGMSLFAPSRNAVLRLIFYLFLIADFGFTEPITSPTNCTGIASQNGNLRSGPGTSFDVVGAVTSGETLAIAGRNQAGDWIQVLLNDGVEAWMAGFLLTLSCAPESLPITS